MTRIPRRALVGFALVFATACGGSDSEEPPAPEAITSDDAPPVKETTGAELPAPETANEPSFAVRPFGSGGGGGGSSSGAGSDIDTSSNGGGSTSSSGGSSTSSSGGSSTSSSGGSVIVKPLYVPPECGADCLASDIPSIIVKASKKYKIPRWFYYAIIRRESSFNRCKTQTEAAANADWGRGLTQVTFSSYAGVPYPQHLTQADNKNTSWRDNMGLGVFGPWINMADVTPIPSAPASEQDCLTKPKKDDAYDPATNIDRFSSGYAAPAYHLFRVATDSPEETWRKVAYHWHYGLWGSKSGKYPVDPRPYLTCAYCYDTYVKQYKPAVEADDGVYQGPTCKPPYQASGC